MGNLVDTFWLILSASFVFIMQAGFLCLEAGLTRRKNSINMAIKNLADFGISVISFWGLGYGLMFGVSAYGWIGHDRFLLEFSQSEGWPIVFFVFQVMFCSTAVTILSGAVAERMAFKGYLLIAVLVSGLIYPVFGHWAWNGLDQSRAIGWLGSRGFVDFAGSTVVHSLGGWTALAAAIIIGPRIGRFSKKRSRFSVPSSDLPLALLGTLLLWFGWFGFNGGSNLVFDERVASILAHTLLAGAAGMTTPLLWLLMRRGKVSVTLLMNGTLAGLVSITANCHAISASSSLLIGGIAGFVMMGGNAALEYWRIDDAVGVIPVHLGAGIWGTIAVAIFGDLSQLGTDLSRLAQFKVQLSGILACGLWSFTVTLVCLSIVNHWLPLRVTKKQEYLGLNISEHGANNEFQDLYGTMKTHVRTGDLKIRAPESQFTEVGQISRWYNQVVRALERSVAKTDAIVTAAIDGIVTVDPETLVVQSSNPAIESIFGYPWLRIIGKPLTRLMGSELKNQKGGSTDSLRNLLEKGCQTGAIIEAVGLQSQGRQFPIELTVTASRIAKDSFWTVIVRDVTARKAAEMALRTSELRARQNAEQLEAAIVQLKEAQAQLLQSEKMASLGHLVSGISHEINNPVSFVYGNLVHVNQYIDDLLEVLDCYHDHCAPPPEEIQAKVAALEIDFLREDLPKVLASMKTGTERIRTIVDSLKNFARHNESDFKIVDIHEGIDSTMMILAHQLRATHKRPAIQVQKNYGNVAKLECYASALNQVFLNMLINAIEALETHQEGIITITTQSHPDRVMITIADNGSGIPETIQPNIFDPFFTTKEVGQGTGMGLAVSHQIVVEKHGGQIHCYSSPQTGTQFAIVLPVT